MIRTDYRTPRHKAHIAEIVALTDRRCACRTDCHVHPSVHQRIPHPVKYFRVNIQLDIREMMIKIQQKSRYPFRFYDTVNGDAELSAPAVGYHLTLMTCGFHFFDDITRFFDKQRPGGCQFNIAVTPFKQRNRQPLFQLADTVADGRRHPVQFLCRRTETACPRHSIHHIQRIF